MTLKLRIARFIWRYLPLPVNFKNVQIHSDGKILVVLDKNGITFQDCLILPIDMEARE